MNGKFFLLAQVSLAKAYENAAALREPRQQAILKRDSAVLIGRQARAHPIILRNTWQTLAESRAEAREPVPDEDFHLRGGTVFVEDPDRGVMLCDYEHNQRGSAGLRAFMIVQDAHTFDLATQFRHSLEDQDHGPRFRGAILTWGQILAYEALDWTTAQSWRVRIAVCGSVMFSVVEPPGVNAELLQMQCLLAGHKDTDEFSVDQHRVLHSDGMMREISSALCVAYREIDYVLQNGPTRPAAVTSR